MSLVVEALVSSAIGVLVEKLASSDVLQFASQEQIHADLDKWKEILLEIKKVLEDAEMKQMTDESVETWLGELKNLAYDVEDMLDEYATEALQRKLMDKPQASTGFKVRKFIPTCCTRLNPRSLKLNSAIATQIKEITTRFEEIVEQKNKYGLIEVSGAGSNRAIYQKLPAATSLIEPNIYGRDNDKEKILEFLSNDEGTHTKCSVISIEGMGGVGKTTLAQLVYHDAWVDHHFQIKAWACVSIDFNLIQVTKTILQSITRETSDVNDLDMLQTKLKEKLSGKKFFIVLDDVWNEENGDYENWTKLCLPFEGGSEGSKIIVTTRDHSVSQQAGALLAYQLKELSYNDCLSVFTQHSLGKKDFSEHEYLEEIGKKIITKCAGLPLAAKTLGGLLRGKPDCKQWENVLESNIWNLPQKKPSGFAPALKVSYFYLPSHLKRCFAYCSLFPKDYEFQKKDLILLWMAEGFLQPNTKKEMEDMGEKYFDDLHSRSFFQESKSHESYFVMHDLINDLAQWAANDFCFRIENLQEGEGQLKNSNKLRHLSYDGSNYNCIKKSGAFNEMKGVRTFLTLPQNSQLCDLDDFLGMVLQLRHLRVLSLKRCSISELPDSIGEMKLLHHLDLSSTSIEFLPDSINKLYNLETLLLKRCYQLKRLCSDMGNLIKLRHLIVDDENHLEAMPLRIGKLTRLRTLQLFVVGKDMGSRIRELKDLTHLRERLHISRLENVNDLGDAEKANLNSKGGLKDIQLKWNHDNIDGSNEKEIAAQVLERLRPCQKLESLHIRGYRGTRFPQWLGHTSLSSLVSLTFEDCKNYASFPSIGQLSSLKKLVIRNIDGIECLGQEFYGHGYYSRAPFQSLEEFTIESLQDWKDWFPCGSSRNVEAFPRLEKLSIRKCSKLEGKLPEHLPSLKSLLIEDCEQWKVSVPRLPEDCTIQIAECKEVVLSSIKDCSSLSSMVHLLSGISSCMFIAEGFLEVEKLDIVAYDEPTSFWKCGNHSLEELLSMQHYINIGPVLCGSDKERLQQKELPERFQYLILEGCQDPVKLEQALPSLNFLRGIIIRKSMEIKFFPEAGWPSQLRFIVIGECDALQSLPMAWMHSSNTSLEELSITNCDSLKCIARVQLPSNLKQLEIDSCSNLLTVVDEEEVSDSCNNTSCLEHLKIECCPSLTSLWSKSDNLTDTLRKINVSSCSNLTTLASSGSLPKALRYLSITECSKLESIAKGFHDNTKLEKLYIVDCEKLETLPSGINNLISLKKLRILNCPAMVSIPEGGFPTSLTSLVIKDTNICKSLFEWGLHRLTSLEVLDITGGCPDVMSFPQEEIGIILPVSLKSLQISHFPNLERISSIAQNLTCLEKLTLSYCPKLEYFPDDGLPQSLKQYGTMGCPVLEEKCRRGGDYWDMIAHLPFYPHSHFPYYADLPYHDFCYDEQNACVIS